MESDRVLVYALARMRFLHTPEKLLLFDMAGEAGGLLSLSRDTVSRYIGRTLRTDRWDPLEAVREAEEDVRVLERRGISSAFYWDADYPPALREIFDPPFVLFYRGNLPAADKPAVGIVGTRKPSGHGMGAAYSLGHEFALNAIPVISGLARGIDRAAHDGVVKAGGRTFAVLGCGIETVYPAENRRLAETILSTGGGLISEYAPGTPPLQYHFPERNRIISGLSRSVIAVEAPLKSGALITTAFALEQGRDVYVHACGAVDGETTGTGKLVQDGAPVVERAADVLMDWGITPVRIDSRKDSAETAASAAISGKSLAMSLERELRAGGTGSGTGNGRSYA